MKRDLKKHNQSGQAAIEFVIVVLVVFFFLFFFLSISILIVTSEYIDYATFMAARTYKAGFGTKEVQQSNARKVFLEQYMPNVQGIARNIRLEFVNATDDEQTSGVVATYDMDMFYLPPLFVGNKIPPSKITLQSEAHLGRDPAGADCRAYFDNFAQQFKLGIDGTSLVQQMEDNGC